MKKGKTYILLLWVHPFGMHHHFSPHHPIKSAVKKNGRKGFQCWMIVRKHISPNKLLVIHFKIINGGFDNQSKIPAAEEVHMYPREITNLKICLWGDNDRDARSLRTALQVESFSAPQARLMDQMGKQRAHDKLQERGFMQTHTPIIQRLFDFNFYSLMS